MAKKNAGSGSGKHFCTLKKVERKPLPATIASNRARIIRQTRTRWALGTSLSFAFMEKGKTADADVVRKAFRRWSALGIQLSFHEVPKAREADIRIAFDQTDGSWSYVGTDIRTISKDEPTMNFGWSLTADSYGMTTALHEIGHTLGFPHEHQNPNAGIVWNEEKVYQAFAADPNYWDRETTYSNVIQKISPSEVQGSKWDPKSIMHYSFDAGLILKPAVYRNKPLVPPGTLSATDIATAKKLYGGTAAAPKALAPLRSQVFQTIKSGQQLDFEIVVNETESYSIRTMGKSDTTLLLYELDDKGAEEYICGDDDSGEDKNAAITTSLVRGRRYKVKLRVNYRDFDSPVGIIVD